MAWPTKQKIVSLKGEASWENNTHKGSSSGRPRRPKYHKYHNVYKGRGFVISWTDIVSLIIDPQIENWIKSEAGGDLVPMQEELDCGYPAQFHHISPPSSSSSVLYPSKVASFALWAFQNITFYKLELTQFLCTKTKQWKIQMRHFHAICSQKISLKQKPYSKQNRAFTNISCQSGLSFMLECVQGCTTCCLSCIKILSSKLNKFTCRDFWEIRDNNSVLSP